MQIDTKQYALITHAAQVVDVARTTLDSAVRTGAVDSVEIAGGALLVSLVSAKRWKRSERKMGRPKEA